MEKTNKDNERKMLTEKIVNKCTINMDAYIKNLKPSTIGQRRVPPPPSIITMIRSISPQNTSVNQKTKLVELKSPPPNATKIQTIFNSEIERLFLQLDTMPKQQLNNNYEKKLSSNEMTELYEELKQKIESYYLPQIKELILKRAFNDKIMLCKLMKINQKNQHVTMEKSAKAIKESFQSILEKINDPIERFIVKMKFKAKNYQLTEEEANKIVMETRRKIKSYIYPNINPIFQYFDEHLLKILIKKHIECIQELQNDKLKK